MPIGPELVELWYEEVEKSSLENSKIINLHSNQKDNGFSQT